MPELEAAARRETERARRLFNRAAPLFLLIERWLEPQYGAALDALELPPGLSALDLGTGTGSLAKILAERGHTVTGIDVAERLLRRAARRVPGARFRRMDLADLAGIPDGAFDLVSVAYVLHGLSPELRRLTLGHAARIAAQAVLIFDYAAPGPWYVRLVEHLEGPHYPGFVRAPIGEALAGLGLSLARTVPISPASACWLFAREDCTF
ncbi:MAG TPA: class I SAM-dependent methyltransferase [Thermoanaerobaculaceae bacterium]|nr:class I SAM-dependent methyltransferase [Thermoanaerobaculaceae bacterium]HQU33993.1 class I SAM-dependent methyltransferase [Thermoanaerobaculaceae bacterium]